MGHTARAGVGVGEDRAGGGTCGDDPLRPSAQRQHRPASSVPQKRRIDDRVIAPPRPSGRGDDRGPAPLRGRSRRRRANSNDLLAAARRRPRQRRLARGRRGRACTLVGMGRSLLDLPLSAARLWQWVVPRAPEYDPTGPRRAWLLMVYTVRRWLIVDRGLHLASSLALETLLALVPLAGVLLFFVRLLDPEFGRDFLSSVAEQLIPEASRAADFTARVVELGTHVNVEQLGVWGFLLVALLAFWLFVTLERTLNTIWRVAARRPLWAQFTMFYTVATLGPVAAFYSVAQPVLSRVTQSVLLTPWLTSVIGLTLAHRLVPHTSVRWRAAIAGGVLSATLFELSKLSFGAYVTHVTMATYEGVYGSFAILPVFVVWSYLSWLIVLLGAEFAFVLQHLPAVARQGYVHPADRHDQHLHSAPGRSAAQLLLAICDNYTRRELGTTADTLDARFQFGQGTTLALLEQLESAGFVVALDSERGYIPSQPPDQLRLLDTLQLFSAEATFEPQQLRRDALADVFDRLDRSESDLVGDLDFGALVAAPRTELAAASGAHGTPPAAERRRATS
ncbi:MAG: YihY/virulence factor BrkB family protein [Myxococcales bacterium FL481]|nr:MAG: YihY/virulence factor BrkB family protein [Myxococcales bacterium FL481]